MFNILIDLNIKNLLPVTTMLPVTAAPLPPAFEGVMDRLVVPAVLTVPASVHFPVEKVRVSPDGRAVDEVVTAQAPAFPFVPVNVPVHVRSLVNATPLTMLLSALLQTHEEGAAAQS